MNSNPEETSKSSCFICGAHCEQSDRKAYSRCEACHHQRLRDGGKQTFIINENLASDSLPRRDVRDRFQAALARKVSPSYEFLVDVGCGPGRFLYLNRSRYARHLGVEITDECLRYGRERLGLNMTNTIDDLKGPPSLVTSWHSLEHFPDASMKQTLAQIRSVSTRETRVLICVPNGESWQARLFKTKWTYYDVPNHLHQFSSKSLDYVLGASGFEPLKDHFAFVYIFAGYLLSVANLVTPGHNFYYYRKKRGHESTSSPVTALLLDLVCYGAFMLATPIGIALSLTEFFLPDRRAVITRSYRIADGDV